MIVLLRSGLADKEDLAGALFRLAKERLNKKQKLILSYLFKNSERCLSSYRIAMELSKCLPCSRSAVYSSINSLKKYSLVSAEAGTLKLTGAGLFVTGGIHGIQRDP